MTIEEDFETVRECVLGVYGKDPHAALDRIEAERRWLWDGLKIHGEDFATCRQERDALKAELEETNTTLWEAYRERDALKATNARLTGMLPTSDYNEIRQERDALKAEVRSYQENATLSTYALAKCRAERDALKAALEFYRDAPFRAGCPDPDIARQALAKLEA